LATRWWKNSEDIFIRFGATHERAGRTDGHRVTAIAALCIASQSHGKNCYLHVNVNVNGLQPGAQHVAYDLPSAALTS